MGRIKDNELFYMEFSNYVGESTSTILYSHNGDNLTWPQVKEVDSMAKHFAHHKATKNPDVILFEEVTTRRYINRAEIKEYWYTYDGYLYIKFKCDINGSYTYKFKKTKEQYESFCEDMTNNYNLEPTEKE